jgi:hypothetical protein
MAMIADILLFSGAMAAGFYCWILSRRLRRFTDLENGVGGAVAVLSAQVDDLTKALGKAQATSKSSVSALNSANERAEAASQRLELLMASLHDLPEPAPSLAPSNPFFVRHPATAGDASV